MLRSEIHRAQREEAAAQEFLRLIRQWREESGGYSSPKKIISSPAYQQVIAMGEAAVPLILKEIQASRGMFLEYALRKITGADATDESMRGQVELINEAWVKWGRDHKYI